MWFYTQNHPKTTTYLKITRLRNEKKFLCKGLTISSLYFSNKKMSKNFMENRGVPCPIIVDNCKMLPRGAVWKHRQKSFFWAFLPRFGLAELFYGTAPKRGELCGFTLRAGPTHFAPKPSPLQTAIKQSQQPIHQIPICLTTTNRRPLEQFTKPNPRANTPPSRQAKQWFPWLSKSGRSPKWSG